MMDDLISRRDAINAVSEITTTMSVCTNKDECYGMKRMQKQAITELENMPSAEQEAPDINVGNMDTTTHDSIPAETGKNDGDGTSGDYISRQQSVDALRKMQTYKLFAGDDMLLIDQAEAQTELMMLPPTESEPSQVARDIATILENEKDMRVIATQPETAKRIVGKSRGGMTLWYQCDTCNEPVDAQDNYCRGCGRRLIDG